MFPREDSWCLETSLHPRNFPFPTAGPSIEDSNPWLWVHCPFYFDQSSPKCSGGIKEAEEECEDELNLRLLWSQGKKDVASSVESWKEFRWKLLTSGDSLVVQWLGLHTITAGAIGSILGQETKILHATQYGQTKTN